MNPHLQDLIRYAEHFIATPYIYGGNHPRTGFDCSGYICYVLRSVGLVGTKEDLSAQGLYDKFSDDWNSNRSLSYVPTGSLLFYGRSREQISHVSLVASPYSVLECGGGDSTTTTKELADIIGGGVKRSWINHRTDKVGAVYPPYPWDPK